LRDNANWLSKIRVVRDQHSNLEASSESITQKVSGDIDVGPLLFGLDNSCKASAICQRQGYDIRQEVAKDDFQDWYCS
jgi:hypothetical protein